MTLNIASAERRSGLRGRGGGLEAPGRGRRRPTTSRRARGPSPRPRASSRRGGDRVTVAAEARVVGDWLLEERIGGGGQAIVYRARHVGPGGTAAVKVFHRSVWADPSFRARFRRECDALSALRHAHIVPIRDCGEDDGRGFLAMALARGGTLAAAPGRRADLPARGARRCSRGSPTGLDAAHARGPRAPRRHAGQHPARPGRALARRLRHRPPRGRHDAHRRRPADRDRRVTWRPR